VPVFQPDRRIVTKCDLCRPRLDGGQRPACVEACPTHAITVEKVDVAAWRQDHAGADAPHLPSSSLTLSTTRIALPEGVPLGTYAASDWNVRPEDPHWPLVWLTLVTEAAAGASATASGFGQRAVAAALAAAGMVGATFHLGRPVVAYKALRNLRRSWLSREVAVLSLFAALAVIAVVLPGLAPLAALAGAAGLYASARLYVVPGRPAWNSALTIVRFAATALALGPLLTGHRTVAAAGLALALAATAGNWLRLARSAEPAAAGALRLELDVLRSWTLGRFVLGAIAIVAALAGAPLVVAGAAAVACEVIGRWLFYVGVVPLNMPGAFWRGAAGSHR
jgi:DMSO reductase anchor subunit